MGNATTPPPAPPGSDQPLQKKGNRKNKSSKKGKSRRSKKKGPGRPRFVFTPEMVKQVGVMAGLGMPNAKIAMVLGCSEDTLYRAAKDKNSPVFAELSKGRAMGDMALLTSTYQMAMAKKFPAINIFLMKTRLRMREPRPGEPEDPEPDPTQPGEPDGPASITPQEQKAISEWAKAQGRAAADSGTV